MSEQTNRVLVALGTETLPETIVLRGVVIAAHPDDEIIGVGARLARWPGARIVHVTDGAPRDMRDAAALGIVRREDYASLRRAERRHALDLAGIGAAHTHDLAYIDNEGADHLIDLTADIFALLRALAPDVVITHPYEGGHPDHDATAFATHAALELLRRNGRPRPVLVEMASYHLGEKGIVDGRFLPASTRDDVRTPLDERSRALKERMLACHASQTKVLFHFACETEPIRLAPAYDFGSPPHEGRLLYEHFGWFANGAQWRARAREARYALGLSTEGTSLS